MVLFQPLQDAYVGKPERSPTFESEADYRSSSRYGWRKVGGIGGRAVRFCLRAIDRICGAGAAASGRDDLDLVLSKAGWRSWLYWLTRRRALRWRGIKRRRNAMRRECRMV
jgi:hypothetical protein